LAGVALDEGRTERAARLLGAAAALADATGMVILEPGDRQQVERDVAAARERLGQGGFAAAWEAGRGLPLAAAIAEARADDAPAPTPVPAPTTRSQATAHGLTARELDVLRLLVDGKTDREIAAALFIGLRTAQGHVANILAKLGVGSRTAAATAALAGGIVTAPPPPPE
jgi:DNA-binding CsgD family transcriptional regulator